MTPGFSLRRIFNRRRYFYALIAADPNQAVTHTVNYWVSKGAWGETNGMREQLAQHGWVGAEIIIGSDLRSLAIRPLRDTHATQTHQSGEDRDPRRRTILLCRGTPSVRTLVLRGSHPAR